MRNYKEMQNEITKEMTDLEQRRFFHQYFTHNGEENKRWIIKSSDLQPGDVITSFFGIPFVIDSIRTEGVKITVDATIERRWNETYQEGHQIKNQEIGQMFINVYESNSI